VSFAVRGIIEGFYNRLWPWPVRERFAEAVARMGFTVYAYAPKEDRFQNAGWRTPYPDIERRRLADFAERCRRRGMEPWFGLRPVGISYADDRDAALALDKLRDYRELGAARLILLADDIPLDIEPRLAGRFADLAEAHAWLIAELGRQLDGTGLVFCPTEYHGIGAGYLRKLAASVPPEVALFWTGPQVCSRSISSEDARAIGEVLGRPPLIWDNYPVNDAGMVDELHIGPIRDREADLDEWVSGVLVNPAMEAEASLVPLATWAEYLRHPQSYDPDAAWQRALLQVCGRPADAEAVAALAAHADKSVIHQPWRRDGQQPVDTAARRAASLANRQLADDLRRFVERLPRNGD
jgi:hyaluronoglucosaminidase